MLPVFISVEVNVASGVVPDLVIVYFVAVSETTLDEVVPADWSVKAVLLAERD